MYRYTITTFSLYKRLCSPDTPALTYTVSLSISLSPCIFFILPWELTEYMSSSRKEERTQSWTDSEQWDAEGRKLEAMELL